MVEPEALDSLPSQREPVRYDPPPTPILDEVAEELTEKQKEANRKEIELIR